MSSHPRAPLVAPALTSPPLSEPSLSFQPLPPYLGARAHLSLSWLSQTFLSLLLLLASVGLLLSTVGSLVANAKADLASACTGLEAAADVAVSLPHYVAEGVNGLTVVAARAVTDGLADSLNLLLLAVQEIVIFMIEMYIGLYVCLLDAIVSGALSLVIDATGEAESFIESAFAEVGSALNSSVSEINTALNKVESVVNDLGLDLDYQIDASTIVSDMENFNFSVSFIDELKNLSASVPTYDDLKQDLTLLISTPITALRSTITSSLSNATLTVEDLPVPASTSVSFCASIDDSFLDDVGHTLSSFLKLALGLLVLALIILAAFNLLWEKWRYRRYVDGVERARDAWQLDLSPSADRLSTASLLAFLGAAQSPTVSYYLARLATWLRLSPARRSDAHWFGAYVLHPWAVLFLVVGCVGLVVVQVEVGALEGPVRRAAEKQAGEGVSGLGSGIVGAIDGAMNATSQEWADGTNAALAKFADGINDDLFGYIDTGIVALNTTLATFYTDLTDSISSFLNNTVFESIALDLIYCLIGSKISSLETALTYLDEHLNVTMPTVPASVLMVSPNATAEMVSQLTSANSSVSGIGLVDKMVAEYARTLRSQRMGFVACIALWGVVLGMGIVGVWCRVREERRWRGVMEGKGKGRGIKKFSLGGGKIKEEVIEMGEKGGRADRSSYQPLQGGRAPGKLATAWQTLAATAGSYLTAPRTRLDYEAVRLRPHRSPAADAPVPQRQDHATPSSTPFATLRTRIPRPTPAFRTARDAFTRVLPAATKDDSVGIPVSKAGHATLQTWDPPTSPAGHLASNGSRMRAFLASSAPPPVPPRPTSGGYESLASPAGGRFVLGEDDAEWPPSPPYQRSSVRDPFADPGRIGSGLGAAGAEGAGASRTSLLLATYPVLQFSGVEGAEHPFAPAAEEVGRNPFEDGAAAARGSGLGFGRAEAGLGMQVSGYRVGGSGRPAGGVNPFVTPLDGEGEA